MERDSRTCHAQDHLPVADAGQTGLREENAPASNLELTRNRGIVGRGKCWPWDDYPVVGDGERLYLAESAEPDRGPLAGSHGVILASVEPGMG